MSTGTRPWRERFQLSMVNWVRFKRLCLKHTIEGVAAKSGMGRSTVESIWMRGFVGEKTNAKALAFLASMEDSNVLA